MKEFLSREGHTFVDRNVEEEPDAYDELVALGFRVVPVTLIGGRSIKGFDPAALGEALDQLRRPADR
ncbi:MAG: glutaredoxin family protein [Acidobacteria bacterium]|nr:glutaredoxin family protein [Acidobacteriota bacterium]